ncbi:MAG: site-specific integrase [Planctomycetia bacterium]|nr:site-specific integrase [Planctomycetia bacterium]
MNQGKEHQKRRRRSKGLAWYWQQTDAWYYTPPGTKKRVPLFDERGQRIHGKDQKQTAELALARLKVNGKWHPTAAPTDHPQWLVARVCSDYLEYCTRGVARGTISAEHRAGAVWCLNDLSGYCGALPVPQLTKEHVRFWIDGHATWRSPATVRNVIAIVLAAFNLAQDTHDVRNPLAGLKKPPPRPRLQSFTPEDEQAIYGAAKEPFRNFLFAGIHTGLRPFCELARLTADDVIETERGMMWRVYSSKTRKTRKIPVRLEVADLVRKILKSSPRCSGVPLFQNPQGKRWLKPTGGDHFRRIKCKLGWDQDPVRLKYSCYTCRHTFAHRMLSGYWNGGAGCSIETLAELIGDTPKVAFDHYGKEWGQHYQEPLWRAIGVGQEQEPVSPSENAGSKNGSVGTQRRSR